MMNFHESEELLGKPKLQELTGVLRSTSDLRSQEIRLRYLKSVAVGPATGQTGSIRLSFPRDRYMDLSTLRFRGKLTVTTTDGDCVLDGSDIGTSIERCKVFCGNKLLYDAEENHLMKNISSNLHVTEHDYKNFSHYKALYPQSDDKAEHKTRFAEPGYPVIGKLGPVGKLVKPHPIEILEHNFARGRLVL